MIQKHQFKQVAAFAGLYFLAIGLGVLLGSLVDNRGNMFYAPAFSALVGGGIYRIYVEKIQRTGAVLVVALMIGAFFLFTRHGAGAFLPALVGGGLAELVATSGRYHSKIRNALSFLLFSFTTTGPILMMWIQPDSYRASLLARGKSIDYVNRVMVSSDPATITWFVFTVLLGAGIGWGLSTILLPLLAKKGEKDAQ